MCHFAYYIVALLSVTSDEVWIDNLISWILTLVTKLRAPDVTAAHIEYHSSLTVAW
jgi:hypothetical protein